MKPNQNLYSISMMYARRYDEAILDDIRELNPRLRDPRRIQSGQIVRIQLSQKVACEFHAAREQNAVPQEFPGQWENS